MADRDALDIAPETALPGDTGRGVWAKLKRGLGMTHTELMERLASAWSGRAVLDEESMEYLEEALIAADLGVETVMELLDGVREQARGFQGGDIVRLRELLVDQMAILLLDAPRPTPVSDGPLVTLVVGVNGVGKTTSIAKLAWRARREGRSVILAAADTFRAAAAEQLATWADRLEVDVVRQGSGADPGAVVYDALAAARARGADQVIVDTAGRLHTKDHLMQELAKIRRVIERSASDWQLQTLLVVDATTGQNAISQAREFHRITPIDGVILAKLDGTAKGGVAVAIARELRLPMLYLGVGEGPEDLVPFRSREFAAALLG